MKTIVTWHNELKSKKVSATEITQHYLRQIKTLDKDIGAFLAVNEASALQTAKQVDEKIAKGQKISPLTGIPAAIKDNMNIKGEPTTCASKILKGFVAPYNATVIEKLTQSDCVFVGKTNMDEFAMGSSTENSAFQKTKNPVDLQCVPGGSSGGSAAAVAGDLAAFSLGSDTGGSIRQPASFCGVVGMKPTYGRVSRFGLVAFASSLDQIGPFTQNVEDCAHVMNALCGFDEKDSTSSQFGVPDFTTALKTDVAWLKIAVPKELMGAGIDPKVAEQIQNGLKLLEKRGASITEVEMPSFKHALSTYYLVATAEASANLARFDGVRFGFRNPDSKNLTEMFEASRSAGFGDEVKRRIMLGTYALSSGYYDAYYLKAQKVRTLIKMDYERIFKDFHVIITPTAPTVAFKFGEKTADPLSMYLSDIATIPVNLAGVPAISIPCGKVGHLPVGLQITGKPFDEVTVLQVAHTLEKALQ